jgi:aminomethyltransferase
MSDPRATPFHSRAASANRGNAWVTRNGVTLVEFYTVADDEALAARARVVIADISWRWRAMLEGARAAEFMARLLTKDAGALNPGEALKALWLSDAGGVRGACVAARHGKQSYLIAAAAPDGDWIAAAAARFEVALRDVSESECGVAIVGPYAGAVLNAAGLDTAQEPLAFKKIFWRGLDVTLSRFGELGGFEIWCAADDAIPVWDRIEQAGAAFGLQPAGLAAMDVLDVEAGVARPIRDYSPAREVGAASPTPMSLGLERLIDADHDFNGRAAWLKARAPETKRLVGFEIDAGTPAPHMPVLHGAANVGQTTMSVYSPALRRAIALAQVHASAAEPGTVLSVALPSSVENPALGRAAARVVPLPFLPSPDPIVP